MASDLKTLHFSKKALNMKHCRNVVFFNLLLAFQVPIGAKQYFFLEDKASKALLELGIEQISSYSKGDTHEKRKENALTLFHPQAC